MNFTRWGNSSWYLQIAISCQGCWIQMSNYGKVFLKDCLWGCERKYRILKGRRSEFDISALKWSLNAWALRRELGRPVYFIVKIYLQSECILWHQPSGRLCDLPCLPEAEESEAAGGCRPGLCPQAQLAASSTLLAGPPSGQHLYWLHGDYFGEAAAGKLEEHRDLRMKEGVQVTYLLPANDMLLGESTSLSLSVSIG